MSGTRYCGFAEEPSYGSKVTVETDLMYDDVEIVFSENVSNATVTPESCYFEPSISYKYEVTDDHRLILTPAKDLEYSTNYRIILQRHLPQPTTSIFLTTMLYPSAR
jgi:hypothetical protein